MAQKFAEQTGRASQIAAQIEILTNTGSVPANRFCMMDLVQELQTMTLDEEFCLNEQTESLQSILERWELPNPTMETDMRHPQSSALGEAGSSSGSMQELAEHESSNVEDKSIPGSSGDFNIQSTALQAFVREALDCPLETHAMVLQAFDQMSQDQLPQVHEDSRYTSSIQHRSTIGERSLESGNAVVATNAQVPTHGFDAGPAGHPPFAVDSVLLRGGIFGPQAHVLTQANGRQHEMTNGAQHGMPNWGRQMTNDGQHDTTNVFQHGMKQQSRVSVQLGPQPKRMPQQESSVEASQPKAKAKQHGKAQPNVRQPMMKAPPSNGNHPVQAIAERPVNDSYQLPEPKQPPRKARHQPQEAAVLPVGMVQPRPVGLIQQPVAQTVAQRSTSAAGNDGKGEGKGNKGKAEGTKGINKKQGKAKATASPVAALPVGRFSSSSTDPVPHASSPYPLPAASVNHEGYRRGFEPLGDDVTALIVRNVPARCTQAHLLEKWPALGCYNLLYVPYDHRRRRTMGFAFMNFVSHEAAMEFRERWRGQVLVRQARTRALDITSAEVQGLEANIMRLSRSKKIRKTKCTRHMPIVIEVDGCTARMSGGSRPPKLSVSIAAVDGGPSLVRLGAAPVQEGHFLLAQLEDRVPVQEDDPPLLVFVAHKRRIFFLYKRNTPLLCTKNSFRVQEEDLLLALAEDTLLAQGEDLLEVSPRARRGSASRRSKRSSSCTRCRSCSCARGGVSSSCTRRRSSACARGVSSSPRSL